MQENKNGILRVVATDDDGAALVSIGIASGPAGTPSSDVVSVQGVSGGTPVPTTASGPNYETVAASQTAQVLGGAGAIGDYIDGLLIIPAVIAAGLVTLLDGATSIPIYVGGATTALPDVKPFYVRLGMKSVNGPWKVTTGANVSVIGIGSFTA